jgi:glycosyltransferase involved in cell wall biosynthesis
MADNKSITLVSNNYWTLYKFRYEVIELFLSEGFQVNLIAKNDNYSNKFTNKNIKKYYISLNSRGISIIDEIRTFFQLYRIYKSLNSSLVFHFTIKPNIYGSIICRILSIKSISFITGIGHTFIHKNILQKIIILLYRFALSKVNEIWFTNKADKILFDDLNITRKNKTKIVPGAGIEVPEKIEGYEHNEKKIFLMVSRLQKEKGVMEYLKCSEKYKDNPNVIFMLIGDSIPSDPSSININQIKPYIDNNSIIYKEYQENILEYMKVASCIVLPSYREGMSTVLLEASMMKRPIITTNVPGCIDIIKDQSYGVLCEARSELSLMYAVNIFLNLDQKKIFEMVEKTFDYVNKNFSKKIVLTEYKNSLQHIK